MFKAGTSKCLQSNANDMPIYSTFNLGEYGIRDNFYRQKLHRNAQKRGHRIDMERQYKDVCRIRGINGLMLSQALQEGRPIEFEEMENGDIIIRAVIQVRPECRRNTIDVRLAI